MVLKEIIVGTAIAIGVFFALATLLFLAISLLPSPLTRELLKRWRKRTASSSAEVRES